MPPVARHVPQGPRDSADPTARQLAPLQDNLKQINDAFIILKAV
jgi:hypothetical protein